jgi:hypothetical protein
MSNTPMPDQFRCARCHTVATLPTVLEQEWNAVFEDGMVVALICSACQTPEENAEAEINRSAIDYSTGGTDELGRAYVRDPGAAPRGEDQESAELIRLADTAIRTELEGLGSSGPLSWDELIERAAERVLLSFPIHDQSGLPAQRAYFRDLVDNRLDDLTNGRD